MSWYRLDSGCVTCRLLLESVCSGNAIILLSSGGSTNPTQQPNRPVHPAHQRGHIFLGVVYPEGRAGGGVLVQPAHQRLRAVVARPNANVAAIEHGCDVVRMNAVNHEACDAGALVRR